MTKTSLIKNLRAILWRKKLQKIRKFIPIENEHKESDLASEAEPFDNKTNGVDGEALGGDFEQVSILLEGDVTGEQNKSNKNENKIREK